jgi:hypothetical protein
MTVDNGMFQMPEVPAKGGEADFFFIEREEAEAISIDAQRAGPQQSSLRHGVSVGNHSPP